MVVINFNMNICLKTQAKQDGPGHADIHITARLPMYVRAPGQISCLYHVNNMDDYYLLMLDSTGDLTVVCQRCNQPFTYHYRHQTELAICDSDRMAEQLLAQMEAVVIKQFKIDLVEIITDDLHLFVPEKHDDINLCHPGVRDYLVV